MASKDAVEYQSRLTHLSKGVLKVRDGITALTI